MGVTKAQTGTPEQREETQETIPKSREEIIRYLEEQGVTNPQRYSKPELEALLQEHLNPSHGLWGIRKDPCMGLSALTKPDLQELAELLGVPNFQSMTNGLLMVNIRHTVEEIMNEEVGFGRLKLVNMSDAATKNESYYQWAATQLNANPHQRLKQLIALNRMYTRFYPRPKTESQGTSSSKAQAQTPQPEWPTEPEEETRPEIRREIPKAKAKAHPSAGSGAAASSRTPEEYQIYDDDGYISDSPPAWMEKKVKPTEPPGTKRK
jgi:hypothetical protein